MRSLRYRLAQRGAATECSCATASLSRPSWQETPAGSPLPTTGTQNRSTSTAGPCSAIPPTPPTPSRTRSSSPRPGWRSCAIQAGSAPGCTPSRATNACGSWGRRGPRRGSTVPPGMADTVIDITEGAAERAELRALLTSRRARPEPRRARGPRAEAAAGPGGRRGRGRARRVPQPGGLAGGPGPRPARGVPRRAARRAAQAATTAASSARCWPAGTGSSPRRCAGGRAGTSSGARPAPPGASTSCARPSCSACRPGRRWPPRRRRACGSRPACPAT